MNRKNRSSNHFRLDQTGENAFTRWEFAAVLATLALSVGVVLPALAQSRSRSLQAVCANNLRLIGQAIGAAYSEKGASPVSWRTPGLGSSPLNNNSWYHLSLLSNTVSNPRIFACPSDSRAKPAKDFSMSSDGGLLHPIFLNNAISYALGLDSSERWPDSVLAADRNLRYAALSGGCSSGINPVWAIPSTRTQATGWRAELHGPAGNLLLFDGRVEATSNESVNRWFRDGYDGGTVHFLSPRL